MGSTTIDLNGTYAEYFLRLVRDGHCSGGTAARNLADALAKYATDLDSKAAAGFIEFFDLMRSQPTTAGDIYQEYRSGMKI